MDDVELLRDLHTKLRLGWLAMNDIRTDPKSLPWRSDMEHARLGGKLEGLTMAISYVEEELRKRGVSMSTTSDQSST